MILGFLFGATRYALPCYAAVHMKNLADFWRNHDNAGKQRRRSANKISVYVSLNDKEMLKLFPANARKDALNFVRKRRCLHHKEGAWIIKSKMSD